MKNTNETGNGHTNIGMGETMTGNSFVDDGRALEGVDSQSPPAETENNDENEDWYTRYCLPCCWDEYQIRYFENLVCDENRDENGLFEAVSIFSLMVSSWMIDIDEIYKDGPTWGNIEAFERIWGLASLDAFQNMNEDERHANRLFPVIVYLYGVMRYGAIQELAKVKAKWEEYQDELNKD